MIKGGKNIVILMVEFLDVVTMAVTVMVCNGFWRYQCTHYSAM